MYQLTRTLKISQPFNYRTGLWVPAARGATISNISLEPHIEHVLSSAARINHWIFKGLLPTTHTIEIVENIPIKPPAPPTDSEFITSCLNLQQPLIKLDHTAPTSQLLTQLKGPDITTTVGNVINYIADKFTYQYPPQTRDINEVLACNTSDCGGYHAAFVGLLRLLEIPAIMDFGARLPTCTPHVWAWWWNHDTHEWTMIDINDEQMKAPLSQRVSFALGTAPAIPTFPKPVTFIQNYLLWDFNFDTRLLKQHLKAELEMKVVAELSS
jgi:hypothetical protein